MQRSKHTAYTTHEMQIYEYKGNYFLLEMCQQGQELNPLHGSRQMPSDFSALSAKLPIGSPAIEIGNATLKALSDFDTRPHPFNEFDIPARNRVIASWFGARGMGSLEKNCRVVQIIKYLENGKMHVIPFNNHNINNWNGPMEGRNIVLRSDDSASKLGETVKDAFLIATYHPERKDK